MKVAHYIGDHEDDSWLVRKGWDLVRWGQKGPFDHVTHTEAILQEYPDGSVLIGSSTLRKEFKGRSGVRIKHVRLKPTDWLITEVKSFNRHTALDWFADNEGSRYDVRGVLATLLPGSEQPERYHCTGAVAASVGFLTPDHWTPAQWASICMSLGKDVTAQHFNKTSRWGTV
jgi:hypothetical protein